MNIVVTCCLGDYMKSNVDIIHKTIDGANVIGVDCNEMVYNFVGVDFFFRVPKTLDDWYVDALLKICEMFDADILIPTSGLDIKVILPRINEFKCKVAIGNTPATEIANNKQLFVQSCNANGIAIAPMSDVIYDKFKMADFLAMNGSAFVKFPYGKKRLVTDNLDSVDEYPCIAQKVLVGNEYSCVCLCEKGKVKKSLVALNRVMSGGTALYASIVDNVSVANICEHACNVLGLDGIAEFDLMEDEDGTPWIIECNPRLTATVSLFYAGGVNVIKAMIDYYLTGSFGAEIDNELGYGISIMRFRQDFFFDDINDRRIEI